MPEWFKQLAVFVVGQSLVGLIFFSKFQGKVDAILERQEQVLRELHQAMVDHAQEDDTRFAGLERRITDLVAGLQRLIGQSEVYFRQRPRT